MKKLDETDQEGNYEEKVTWKRIKGTRTNAEAGQLPRLVRPIFSRHFFSSSHFQHAPN